MPTRDITLTAEHDAFIESAVRAGEYRNASEAVRDAIRVLQLRRQEEKLRLEALRAHLAAGLRDLESGDYQEIDANGIGSYLDGLTNPSV
ncbi:MAG: type II toxin-antitoxin system ParD family antitoxin [Rhodomicrobium sp.]